MPSVLPKKSFLDSKKPKSQACVLPLIPWISCRVLVFEVGFVQADKLHVSQRLTKQNIIHICST